MRILHGEAMVICGVVASHPVHACKSCEASCRGIWHSFCGPLCGVRTGSNTQILGHTPSMSFPVDLLLFDLDGTLADTKADIATAVNLTLRDYGLPEHAPEHIYAFVGDGVRALLAKAFESRGAGAFDDALTVFRRHYLAHLLDATQFYPGVLAVLAHFAEKKKAIVTNNRSMSACINWTVYYAGP